MALPWSMASGQTFTMFVKAAELRTSEAERIRTNLRSQLQHILLIERQRLRSPPA